MRSKVIFSFVLMMSLALIGTAMAADSARGKTAPNDTLSTKAGQIAKIWKKNKGRSEVVKISQKLREVIRFVEKSEMEMACGPRKTLVRRLRLIDSALLSGNRTAASGLLSVWIAKARNMVANGTLDPALHEDLEGDLQGILEQIGTGWTETAMPTRNWPPLHSCNPWVDRGVGDYAVWSGGEDVMTLITTAIKEIHPPGRVSILVTGLAHLFWPADQSSDISTLIDQAIEESVAQNAQDALDGLYGVLDDFNYYENGWYQKCVVDQETCTRDDAESTRTAYQIAAAFFHDNKPIFQSNGPAGDYREDLLPLFAQYMTAYLSLLGEGVIWGEEWGWTGDDLAKPGLDLAEELDPTNPDSAISYVNQIYEMGIPYPDKVGVPTHYQDKWTANNAYIRDMTLNVLQFAAVWPFMDPVAYPDGNPNFKYDVMIYSDPIGDLGKDINISDPDNVLYPLSHVKIWVQNEFENFTGWISPVIDAMQMTNAPAVGPVMGDTYHDWGYTTYGCDVAPRTLNGPIVAVSATDDGSTADYGDHVQSLQFTFHNGQYSPLLGSVYSAKHEYYFEYEDWHVANAKIMGIQKVHYDWKWAPINSADCVVFGFRRDDSF